MAAALVAAGALNAGALAQVRASLPNTPTNAGSMSYTLVGRSTQTTEPAQAALELEITPAGLVRVITLDIRGVPTWASMLSISQSVVPVSIQNIRLLRTAGDPAPAKQGVVEVGVVTFSDAIALAQVLGTANHQAGGVACAILQSQGGVCSGPFDFAAAGLQPVRVSGAVPLSGSGPCTLTVSTFAPLTSTSQSWGGVTFSVNITGTLQAATSCIADFNAGGQVTVQDLFDFLAAWFVNDPRADVNTAGGITVQDLFDYLALWFAGCP